MNSNIILCVIVYVFFFLRSTNFTGSKVTVAGWGLDSFGGRSSNVLRKVDLDVLSNSNCNVADLVDKEFCTFTSGKDSCQVKFIYKN